MRVFNLILLISFTFGICIGQGTNPFEIKERLGNKTQDSTIDNRLNEQSASTGNPFDIPLDRRNQATSSTTVEGKKSSSVRSINASGPSQVVTLVYSLAAFILLAVAISFNRRQFTNIFKSLINGTSLKTLFRNFTGFSDAQMLILYLLFFSNVAYVLWLAQGAGIGFYGGYFTFLGAILGIYIIRHLFTWLLGYVYGLGEVTEPFNHSISIHNMVIGVVAIPFILSLGYISKDSFGTIFYFFVAIVLLVYLLRQLKGLLTVIGIRRFNLFYFFIYLCAFEIVPLLISWKVISGAL